MGLPRWAINKSEKLARKAADAVSTLSSWANLSGAQPRSAINATAWLSAKLFDNNANVLMRDETLRIAANIAEQWSQKTSTNRKGGLRGLCWTLLGPICPVSMTAA